MRFHRLGLDFSYPDSWSLDTEDAREGRVAVTVQAPEGGFWSVSGHAPGGRAADLVAAVVAEMRDEYRDLDAEPATDAVAGHVLSGVDLNFYFLDLTNTAQVRTLETPTAVWLLLCQAEDREWDRVAPVFAAMTTSFVRGLFPSPSPSGRGPG
ncbi:MAG: hypothetical protein ACKOZU_07600 [Planctomycetaceae bacterium]